MKYRNLATLTKEGGMGTIRSLEKVQNYFYKGKMVNKVTVNLQVPVCLENDLTIADLDERELKQLILLAIGSNL